MILSLAAYILSFILFAAAPGFYLLFPALFFFSIGEAFRTGTHKAMIFQWLQKQGRTAEKTKVYGYTRSWSKKGSALSVVISTLIVFVSGGYRWIFILSIVPYLVGIWNMAHYPSYLNVKKETEGSVLKKVFGHLFSTLRNVLKNGALKKLIVESTGFEGAFRVSRDFLQPVIKAQALVLGAAIALPERERTAILVGAVYFLLHMLSSSASKKAHLVDERAGKQATAKLTLLASALLLVSAAGLYFDIYALPIAGFVLFYVVHNIWRPLQVSHYDDHARAEEQATVLSVESQSKSVGILVLSPLAGYIADTAGIHGSLAMTGSVLFLLWIYSSLRKV